MGIPSENLTKPDCQNPSRPNHKHSASLYGPERNSGSVNSVSPARAKVVLEGFGGGGLEDENEDSSIVHEGTCYLKTKTDTYKKHWMVI